MLQALRLQPYLVISNQTGVPLQLMQPRRGEVQQSSAGVVPSRATGDGLPGVGVPPGGRSFTGQGGLPEGPTSAISAPKADYTSTVDLPTGDILFPKREELLVTLNFYAVYRFQYGLSPLSDGAVRACIVDKYPQCTHSLLPGKSLGSPCIVCDSLHAPLRQQSCTKAADCTGGSLLLLTAGGTGVPLHRSLQSETRRVCLRFAPDSPGEAGPQWSHPLELEKALISTAQYISLPVRPAASSGAQDAPLIDLGREEPVARTSGSGKKKGAYLRELTTLQTAAAPPSELHGLTARVGRCVKHYARCVAISQVQGKASSKECLWCGLFLYR